MPNFKYPCGICKKSVNSNHRALQCDICDFWVHIKCNGLSDSDYLRLQLSDEKWFCSKCTSEILWC